MICELYESSITPSPTLFISILLLKLTSYTRGLLITKMTSNLKNSLNVTWYVAVLLLFVIIIYIFNYKADILLKRTSCCVYQYHVLRIRSIFFGSGSGSADPVLKIWIRIQILLSTQICFLCLAKYIFFYGVFLPNLSIL